MSRRPLPISFIVGLCSAIALGMAWGLVYFSLPSPPAPVATSLPSSSSAPPTLLSPDTPITIDPALSVPLQPRPDSSSSLSPHQNPLPAPSPSEPVVTPSRPVSKAPKVPSVTPPVPATKPSAAPHPSAPPAEDIPALQNISPACIVELEKLCEGTQPGEARRKCFKDNENKLSSVCQRQMDDMAARIKEDMQHFRTACGSDVKQLCPDVHPGGGNVLQCLEENYKEVSETCYQALKRFQARKAGRSL